MLRLLLVFFAVHAVLVATERKEWAFYGYFVGDEKDSASLETSQVHDMIELKNGLRSDNVHVVVQHDRGTKLNSTLESFYQDHNYSGVMRYQIKSDSVYSVEKIGEKNMGDAQTFYEFLVWAMTHYPANKVVLTVNAHGSGILSWSGPTSIADDQDYDDVQLVDPFIAYDATGDNLTIFEFRKVLQRIQRKFPQTRISVLIFDACLSASVEAISELSPFVDVILGSAETIPGTGMDYQAISRSLEGNPGPRQLAETTAEAFIRSVSGDNVIGAWDMSYAIDFLQALDDLSLAMVEAKEKGVKGGFETITKYEGDLYWDIYDLSENIVKGKSGYSSSQKLVDLANRALKAQSKMQITVWYQGSYSRSDANGLSIFWPDKGTYDRYRNFYKKLLFSKEHSWDDYLDYSLLGIRPQGNIFNTLYE